MEICPTANFKLFSNPFFAPPTAAFASAMFMWYNSRVAEMDIS